jgi:hypothetical protein
VTDSWESEFEPPPKGLIYGIFGLCEFVQQTLNVVATFTHSGIDFEARQIFETSLRFAHMLNLSRAKKAPESANDKRNLLESKRLFISSNNSWKFLAGVL